MNWTPIATPSLPRSLKHFLEHFRFFLFELSLLVVVGVGFVFRDAKGRIETSACFSEGQAPSSTWRTPTVYSSTHENPNVGSTRLLCIIQQKVSPGGQLDLKKLRGEAASGTLARAESSCSRVITKQVTFRQIAQAPRSRPQRVLFKDMSRSILITGASGYLGGSLLAELSRTKLPPHHTIYALVRSDAQAEQVKEYGAEPLRLDFGNEGAVIKTIVEAEISIIFFLIDALNSKHQMQLIKALGELKIQTGQDVHFLHTSGAKIFSEHAGLPTDRDISDADPGLFEMQKTAKAPHDFMKLVCLGSRYRQKSGSCECTHTNLGSGYKHYRYRDLQSIRCQKLYLHTVHRIWRRRGIRKPHLHTDCSCGTGR
jgi:hypothetical protein